MRMMDTGGQLLADDKCNETVRRWKENEEEVVKNFKCVVPSPDENNYLVAITIYR